MSNSILIKNIYYMLTYAFQVLNQESYKSISVEFFLNTAEMFTAILCKGIESQLKRYLNRDYVVKTEALSSLRGSIRVTESINQMSFLNKKLVCSFDEFSNDSYMNKILKSTMHLLLKADISIEQKKSLKSLLPYFDEVRKIDIYRINWKFHFNQNNQTYRMLMGICYLTIKGLLQTQDNGKIKLMDFIDEQKMCRLYEKFILGYYQKHFSHLNPRTNYIEWDAQGETEYLPAMKTDITLEDKSQKKVLIIDTKYYGRTMQSQFGKNSYHSGNMYQIHSYVNNKKATYVGKVSGLLLYAKTDEEVTPNQKFTISGNQFAVQTLDLNVDFSDIEKQLNDIVKFFFQLTVSFSS